MRSPVREFGAHYVAGRWVPARSGQWLEVRNAATEEVIARVAAGTAEEASEAVAAARAAFERWAGTPVERRAELIERVAAGLEARAEEIARAVTAEVGMPIRLSRRNQAALPAQVCASFARLLRQYAFEERLGESLVVREPVGVVAAITPWNYPLLQIVAKVAPALAAGCTVVVKPSELAPHAAAILAEVVAAAGAPAGVFNLVWGTGPVAGEALARHPEVDMISFTGSTRAGRRVCELAAAGIKRVALELGGKSASVVLADADLERAIRGTVASCFLNSGQTCTALTRLLVPESRYEEAARLAVETAARYRPGDPMLEDTRLGPLVSAAQRERVRDYIRRGVAEGAQLLLGGAEPPTELARGYFVRPTVFGAVAPGMAIAQEEIFGPVLSILAYRDEEEAVRIANGTIYGLAAAVWSGDRERAHRIAARLRAGRVSVNGGGFDLLAPFGGYRQSGRGREYGRFGLEEFLEVKAVQFGE